MTDTQVARIVNAILALILVVSVTALALGVILLVIASDISTVKP